MSSVTTLPKLVCPVPLTALSSWGKPALPPFNKPLAPQPFAGGMKDSSKSDKAPFLQDLSTPAALGAEKSMANLMPQPTSLLKAFAVGALTTGIGLSLLAKKPLPLVGNRVGSSAKTALQEGVQALNKELTNSLGKTLLETEQQEIMMYTSKPWPALGRIMHLKPTLMPQVLQYMGIATLGFLGSTVLNGVQESWVRWEESCIRSDMLGRLQQAFEGSLRNKLAQDDAHRTYATQRLRGVLQQGGLPLPPALTTHGVVQVSLGVKGGEVSALEAQRANAYNPYSRQAPLKTASLAGSAGSVQRFGGLLPWLKSTFSQVAPQAAALPLPSAVERRQENTGVLPFMNALKPLLLGASAGLGGLTGAFIHTSATQLNHSLQQQQVQQQAHTLLQQGKVQAAHDLLNTKLPANWNGVIKKTVKETVGLNDLEGMTLALLEQWQRLGQRKALTSLLGVYTLTTLVGVGKLVVDALREIEVTRINAETELNYERYKWLVLDTRYHTIAERTLLEHELERFESDLPALATLPEENRNTLLNQRVNALLSSVGLWSPPPYFSVTPTVQLAEARS